MFQKLLTGVCITLSLTLGLTAAARADTAPDALVKRISSEVIETAKTDKDIQAGDVNKVIALVDTKVMPSVNFEVMTRSAVGPKWREASADQRSKLQAEFKTLLVRVYAGALTQIKDQVVDALLKVTPIDVPAALVDAEVHRLMEAARQDMAQRGMKAKDMPMQPQWFTEQASRRVSLGLVLAELVKKEDLHANAEQVRAMVDDFAQTYENPDEVVSWYYAQPQRLAEVEALVLEDNVVAWVLARAKATDKTIGFDDLMGRNA